MSNTEGVILAKSGLYSIASAERAVVDILYIYGKVEFDDLDTLNFNKCYQIAEQFGRKSIIQELKKLEESVKRLLINIGT